jgi:chromosome segregation ATPase
VPAKKAAAPEDHLDELYVGSFDGFVTRRDDLAKRLRADSDPEEAQRVRALRKPNRVAWALNQLSAEEPDARDELLEAGGELRSAQERLVSGKGDHARAREAQERERRAVHDAADRADAIAERDGAALGAQAERLRQTLHAVSLDEEVREQFAARRLTTHHEAVGLGPVGGTAGSAPAKRSKQSKADRERAAARKTAEKALSECEQARDRSREELDTARTRAQRAQKDLDRAAAAFEEADAAADRAREGLEELADPAG